MKSAKEIQGTSASQQGEFNACTVQPTPSEQVHQVQGGESRKGREPCYRCGGTNHVPSQCRFIGKQCFNCGKLAMGHTARIYVSQQEVKQCMAAKCKEPSAVFQKGRYR